MSGNSAQGAGGVIGIIGALREARQNSQMAEYNAQIARQNSSMVQQQAAEAARRSLIMSNKAIGSQKANFAAAGVSGGSVLDVLQDTASKGELDYLTIKNKGDVQASGYASEDILSRFRASNELTSGYIKSAGIAQSSATKALSGGM